jgi:signal transduction histidine kinase
MILNLFSQLILLLSILTLAVTIIVYSWINAKKSITLNSFLWFLITLFIWSFSGVLKIFVANTPIELPVMQIDFLAICYMGLTWLAFCLYYSEHPWLNSRKNFGLLCIIPTLCYISLLTNPYHHLFFIKNGSGSFKTGILFWLMICETYSYYLLGMALLIKYSLKQFGYKKKQVILLIAASIIPFFVSIAKISNISQPGFNFLPLSLTIFLLLFAVAIFKYKMLNSELIALRKIVDNMKESILVTDSSNKIKDFNQAFVYNFPEYSSIQNGDQINILLDYLLENSENNTESQRIIQAIGDKKLIHTSGTLDLIKPSKKCFVVNIQPIISAKELIGRVISFNDITTSKNLWDELYKKNIELSTKNQQLEQYATTAAELAVAKERNRFARDVHDTLGQTMTLLITLLQITKINCRNASDMVETRLDEALKIASDGLAEVRRSLISMTPVNTISLKSSLQSLVDDFRMSGMKIDLSIDELGEYDDFVYSSVIYRICQEALTNALRHGKANHVTITLAHDKQRMILAITDDGNGCEDLNKGFGLYGMEQRIMRLNGGIIYNHGKTGFGIFVEIPLVS